jgi:hypothetical protein
MDQDLETLALTPLVERRPSASPSSRKPLVNRPMAAPGFIAMSWYGCSVHRVADQSAEHAQIVECCHEPGALSQGSYWNPVFSSTRSEATLPGSVHASMRLSQNARCPHGTTTRKAAVINPRLQNVGCNS